MWVAGARAKLLPIFAVKFYFRTFSVPVNPARFFDVRNFYSIDSIESRELQPPSIHRYTHTMPTFCGFLFQLPKFGNCWLAFGSCVRYLRMILKHNAYLYTFRREHNIFEYLFFDISYLMHIRIRFRFVCLYLQSIRYIVPVSQIWNGKRQHSRKNGKSHIKRMFRRYQKRREKNREYNQRCGTALPMGLKWKCTLSNAFCIHFYSSALYFYFVFFRMCFHSVRTRFIHLKEQSQLFRKINHVAWCVIQCACVRVSCHNQYTPKNIGNAEVKGKKIVRVKRRARFIYFKTQIFGCFCWHWMVEVNWVRHHAKSINRS